MEQLKTFKKGYQALRKGRRSLANHYYLVTSQTHNRAPIFITKEPVQIVLESLQWFRVRNLFSLDTAVVMPDHVHILGQLREIPLENVMQRFKSYSSKSIKAHLNLSDPVWQPGYHDHIVRKEEDLNQVRQYCLNNPVRAGLVNDFHAYAHWYCRWLV